MKVEMGVEVEVEVEVGEILEVIFGYCTANCKNYK